MSEERKEPPRQAIGLAYERASSGAPAVVAKGSGELATRILELARASGVPIHQDPDLVSLLSACAVGEEIPTEVYEAVARLLAWLWSLRREEPPAAGPAEGASGGANPNRA